MIEWFLTDRWPMNEWLPMYQQRMASDQYDQMCYVKMTNDLIMNFEWYKSNKIPY